MHFRRIIVASALLFVSHPSLGQTSKSSDQAARALFAEAVADEGAQKWEQALAKLERVREIKTTSGVLAHLALCKEHLGRFMEAVEHYERAIELARSEKNKPALQLMDEALSKLRPRVPSIRIVLPASEVLELSITRVLSGGAEVSVKKESNPTASDGYTVQVDPGDYAVAVLASGARPFRATRNVPEGQIMTLVIELEPVSTPKPLVAPPPLATLPESRHEGSWTARHTVSIGLLGAGVLAIGGGVVFGLSSNSKKNEADGIDSRLGPGRSICSGASDAQTASTCAQLRDARDAQNARADLSLGLYITGAALVVGGAAVWLLWPHSKSRPEAARVVPVIDVAGRSIGVQGRF